MSTEFPGELDTLFDPSPTTPLDNVSASHDTWHVNANDAIEALEVKVGKDYSNDPTSLDLMVTVLRAPGMYFTSEPTYYVGLNEKSIYVTASTGNDKIVQMPPATGSGRTITIKKIDDSAATVTVTADTGYPDLIDGEATHVLANQWDKVRIQDAAEGSYEEQE